MDVVPIGTIITCPNCGSEICKVIEELHRMDLIAASSLEGIDQEIKPLDTLTCRKCGVPYFYKGKLHTEQGWIP